MRNSRARLASLMVLATAFAGCGGTTQMSERQLARVAKDWCMTIRASQVMPVYPLTEDVVPGDVFLVQTSAADDVSVYRSKGFLPLDNHVARFDLNAADYKAFYGERYDIDDVTLPPKAWQFGPSTFDESPRAAFPSYSFSVSRSAGLNVAVPVNAVPIGLNLLDSGAASGSVTLKQSYTYGLPVSAIQAIADKWAVANRPFLQQFSAEADAAGKIIKQRYLRVVYRVYMTKQVAVSLRSDEAFSGSGSAGVPQPVSLLSLGDPSSQAGKNFELINKIIDDALKPPPKPVAQDAPGGEAPADGEASGPVPATGDGPVAPTDPPAANPPAADAAPVAPPAQAAAAQAAPAVGGTVRVAMASGRTITLIETFDRPLCVGYLAVDLPITLDGLLGPPIATFDRLENRAVQTTSWDDALISRWIGAERDRYQQVQTWLEKHQVRRSDGQIATPADLQAFGDYGAFPAARRQIVQDLIAR